MLKMKKAIEFLLKLDPNRGNVLEQTLANEARIQAYYRAQLHLMVDTHLGSKPFFDRTLTRLVDEGDCMYVHNDFVRPGSHSYFIVVPNGSGGFKYKKQFVTFVKPRKGELPSRTLPRALRDDQEEGGRERAQVPSAIRAQWKPDTEKTLEAPLLGDVGQWKLARLVKQDEYRRWLSCMKENALYLFSLHKHILCESASYPKIGLEDVRELFIESQIAEGLDKSGTGKPVLLSDEEVVRLFSESVRGKEKTETTDGKSGSSGLSLERFQFFELLVRTAIERGKARRTEAPEALQSLIQENLMSHVGEAEVLQDQVFIENEICRGPVNEILGLNRVTLERLYDSCKQSNASASFEIADAVKLLDPLYPHSHIQI